MTKASINVNENFNFLELQEFSEDDMLVLKRLGMIVDDSENEVDNLHYMFNKNYFSKNSFLNIVLVPGLDCNFMCPYCFEKVKGAESLFNTKLDTYFSVLKKFATKNLSNYNMVEISLFGGEPLLFSNQIFDFFEYIDKKVPEISYFSSIVTNGALLTTDIVKRLLAYKCRSMQVTIDGWKQIHDKNRIFKDGRESYDLLLRNINTTVPLLPEDCQFNLRINLNNVTVDEVSTTLADIIPQNRSKIKILFRPIYNTESYKQNNTNKFDALKPFIDLAITMGFDIVRNTYYYQACESCSGDNFFFIMPDLTIWKCINDINFQQAQIGKIDKDGTINFDANKLVQWFKYSNCFDDKKCRQCKLLPDCYGGCVLYKAKNGVRSCKEFEMASLPYLY